MSDQYTMADIADMTMEHLGFYESTDPSLSRVRVVRRINIERRTAWNEIGGRDDSQGLILIDAQAGQPDYALPQGYRVASVAFRDPNTGTTHGLSYAPLSGLTAGNPYPDNTSTGKGPEQYALRSIGTFLQGGGFPQTPLVSRSSPMLTVWPPPVAIVPGGIVIMGGGPASSLPDDAYTVSPLPLEVDEAAAMRAAVYLSIHLSDNQRKAVNIQLLNSLANDLTSKAKAALMSMDGSEPDLVIGGGFGSGIGYEHAGTPSRVWGSGTALPVPSAGGAASLTTRTAPAVAGNSSVVVDTSTAPVPLGSAVLAMSKYVGFISTVAVAPNRQSVTVTLDAGFVFADAPDGTPDTVYVFYG